MTHTDTLILIIAIADLTQYEKSYLLTQMHSSMPKLTLCHGHYVSLKVNESIIIRRADKSLIFVILDKDEYLTELITILSDTSKFQKIKEDPTKKLKAKVNRDLRSANALIGGIHFQTMVGDLQGQITGYQMSRI